MEDSSSFFNYTRMEPPRVVLECKRATPTLGGQLNQAWSWPGRQERGRGANVEYNTIIDFNEVDMRIYLPEKVIIH